MRCEVVCHQPVLDLQNFNLTFLPHRPVILQVGFFQGCGIHCFNAHPSSPCHPAQKACLKLQHPLFNAHPSPSCHSARRACPELQNLLLLEAKEILLPGRKVPVRADEGWWIRVLPDSHPPSATVPSLPEGFSEVAKSRVSILL